MYISLLLKASIHKVNSCRRTHNLLNPQIYVELALLSIVKGGKVETNNQLEKNLTTMEVEEATKATDEVQAEVPSLEESRDTAEDMIKGSESQSENQTNSIEAATNGTSPKSPKNPEEQEDEKHKQPKKEGPSQNGPSKRVREGQKWNDRPRKQYGNQDERPRKRHNNKSDLVSQHESSDPVAIRKQVRTISDSIQLHIV